MARYILSQPGFEDRAMEDGTTAFTAALVKYNLPMICLLLNRLWNDEYKTLTLDTLNELPKCESELSQIEQNLRRVLISALDEHQIPQPSRVASLEPDHL